MNTRTGPGSWELKGWHVLAGMLAFFAAIIAVNVGFAIVAVDSFPGEDVRRSYLQGLNYNDALAERRRQAALGWQAHAATENEAGQTRLVVMLRDREGRPLSGVAVSGELRWPADERLDRALTFAPDGEGRYVAAIEDLRPGYWRLRARAAGADSAALDFEAEFASP
jgi:nitrogen fixation protein FixH